MISNSIYFLAVISSVVSSLRFPYLPEMQLLCLFLVFFVFRSRFKFAVGLVLVLCTNTYAIPDAVFRLTPELYPSIYTKNIIYSIKALDILALLTFFSAILSFSNVLRVRGITILALVFGIALLSTALSVFFGVIEWGYFLFYIRGFLLVAGFFCLVSDFTREQLTKILYFSMFCWVCKMLSMILFPSAHVIQREIFGFQWKIFFAGDEYLYFALISCCVITMNNFDVNRLVHYKKCFFYCFIALILALISQRKGAVPYFFVTFFIMYCSYNGSLLLRLISNLALMVYASVFFIFFFFIYPNLPELYQLAFSEYYLLYVSAVDSMINLFDYNPYGAILGLGSMGLYEIISLPERADHAFSFGGEVGNVYRYAIWNLPFGRLAVNVGLLGFFLVVVFLLTKVHKLPSTFYMYFSLIPVFGMYGVTPVSAIYIGFTLAVLYKKSVSNSFQE